MPEEQSQRSRFQSSYGAGYISLPQYLAELMCERLAKKNGKTLSIKFWDLPEWRKHYLFQVTVASRLLKKYHQNAIFEVLKANKWAYSIGSKQLIVKYKIAHEKYKHLPMAFEYNELKEVKQEEVVLEKPRETFNKNKSLARTLDG